MKRDVLTVVKEQDRYYLQWESSGYRLIQGDSDQPKDWRTVLAEATLERAKTEKDPFYYWNTRGGAAEALNKIKKACEERRSALQKVQKAWAKKCERKLTKYFAVSKLKSKRDRVEFSYDNFTIVLTGMQATCTKCGEVKPASEFGFRRMVTGDHIFRNQPQCITCRSKKNSSSKNVTSPH